MDSNYTMFDTVPTNIVNEHRRGVHVPFLDVDDIAYKTRQHDPTFIASISINF